MNSFLLITLLFLGTQFVKALDPTIVKGTVAVEVDRSKPIWSVKVTNHSKEKLAYEMIGKVPRGLGLEFWGPWEEHIVLKIHAEDLAEALYVDGFPADIRDLLPGKSITFPLNPNSMSATSVEAFAKWKTTRKQGFYSFRVCFGRYTSTSFEVLPSDTKEAPNSKTKKKPPEIKAAPITKEIFGVQLRRDLEKKDQALAYWSNKIDEDGEHSVELGTFSKPALAKVPAWNGSNLPKTPFHELFAKAKEIATRKINQCDLSELGVYTSEDDPSKHYFLLYFYNSENNAAEVKLLLDGTQIESNKLKITAKQYKDLSDYGIPPLKKKD